MKVQTMAPVKRSVICTCGWGAVLPTLAVANVMIERHLIEACEGCDYAVQMEDAA